MKAIFFTDGSCKPNPGYGGFGYFGYTYEKSKKPTKYPETDFYFTSTGINKEKENIVVDKIYEYIEYIKNITTNNYTELYSFIKVLEKCLTLDIDELTIYADSNYIVNNIKVIDTWKKNNWKRTDNKELIHINEWKKIDELLIKLKSKKLDINIKWIKSHNDNFGNEIADFYSVIASNAALINKDKNSNETVIYNSELSYEDFKSSFYSKDFILNFKDMFYNPFFKNTTFHFLTNFEKKSIGVSKKNTQSIFAVNVGFIPEYIAKIKEFIDNFDIKENFYCIRISNLKNSNYLRLFRYINLNYLLARSKDGYKIVTDDADLIYKMNYQFPLIIEVFKTFNFIVTDYLEKDDLLTFDITNTLYDKNKLIIKNSDTFIDLTNKININLLNYIKLEIGKDIPSYLILSNIKNEVKEVKLVIRICYETNTATLYTVFKLNNRELITCHIRNKFLIRT